jgi:hypothetical protein
MRELGRGFWDVSVLDGPSPASERTPRNIASWHEAIRLRRGLLHAIREMSEARSSANVQNELWIQDHSTCQPWGNAPTDSAESRRCNRLDSRQPRANREGPPIATPGGWQFPNTQPASWKANRSGKGLTQNAAGPGKPFPHAIPGSGGPINSRFSWNSNANRNALDRITQPRALRSRRSGANKRKGASPHRLVHAFGKRGNFSSQHPAFELCRFFHELKPPFVLIAHGPRCASRMRVRSWPPQTLV